MSTGHDRERLDLYLVRHGLAGSRRLAQELIALGGSVHFSVAGDATALQLVQAEGLPATHVSSLDKGVTQAAGQSPRVVVADSYHLSSAHFARLRDAARCLVVIDDLAGAIVAVHGD